MAVTDIWHRTLVYFGMADEADDYVDDYDDEPERRPSRDRERGASEDLERSYRELGLTQEADDAARTLAAQRGGMTLAVAPLKVSDAAPPAAGGAAAPAQEGGFFTRMADFFSPLDRSNKEPVEIILPSASGTPEATPAEGAASADAKTGEAAKKKSNRLIVEINTGDEDEEAKKKKAEPAATEPANPPPSASDKQP